RHGYRHCDPHRRGQGRLYPRPGRRRHRGRFRSGRGVDRNPEQGEGRITRRRTGRGKKGSAMLLMLDNYDSFTYNLVQYFGELGEDVRVYRNDEITLEEIAKLNPARIVVSPGPCSPAEAGISVPLIKAFAGKIPLLGVC